MTPAILLNAARRWGEATPTDVARMAQADGLDGVGLADSPLLFPDPLIETDRVLTETSLSLAGPCILSLGLRHPHPVAGGLRTLASRHGDRVVCFVGRGESSVRNADLPVPSMRDYRAAMTELSEMAEDMAERPLLLGSASGPRTITETSGILDGVLIDVGVDPTMVQRAVAMARKAQTDARIWVFLRATIAADEDAARAAVRPVLGSCAARLARAPEWFALTEEEHSLAKLAEGATDYRQHGSSDPAVTENASDAEAMVRKRFFAAGTADDVSAALAPLAGLEIDGVVLAGAVGGVLDHLPELTAAVRHGLTTSTNGGAV